MKKIERPERHSIGSIVDSIYNDEYVCLEFEVERLEKQFYSIRQAYIELWQSIEGNYVNDQYESHKQTFKELIGWEKKQ